MAQATPPEIKAAIKAAYLGSKITPTAAVRQIAAEFNLNARTIWGWISKESWDLEKQTQKIINFDANKTREPRQRRSDAPIDQLEIIENAIRDLRDDLSVAEGREKAQIANALKGLLEYHGKLKPMSARELATRVVDLGISPAEFVAELKTAGWGAQRA